MINIWSRRVAGFGTLLGGHHTAFCRTADVRDTGYFMLSTAIIYALSAIILYSAATWPRV
jgi:hypothetical protein